MTFRIPGTLGVTAKSWRGLVPWLKGLESKKLTPPKFNSLPQKIDDLKDSFPFGDCADCLFLRGELLQFRWFFTQKARSREEFLAAQFKKHHFVRSVYSTFGGTAQNSSDLQITTTNLRSHRRTEMCVFLGFPFNTEKSLWGIHVEKSYPKKTTNIPWSAGPFLEGNESSEPTHQLSEKSPCKSLKITPQDEHRTVPYSRSTPFDSLFSGLGIYPRYSLFLGGSIQELSNLLSCHHPSGVRNCRILSVDVSDPFPAY